MRLTCFEIFDNKSGKCVSMDESYSLLTAANQVIVSLDLASSISYLRYTYLAPGMDLSLHVIFDNHREVWISHQKANIQLNLVFPDYESD